MTKEISYEDAVKTLQKYVDETIPKEEAFDVISALAEFHKNDSSDNWDDFDAMLKDMKQHALNNGQAIEMADRPAQLRWAWECKNTGKTWSIKIGTLKKYKESLNLGDDVDQKKADVLARTMQTQEGKQNLLDVINGR